MVNLRRYIEILDREGDLLRINESLSTIFEIPRVIQMWDGKKAVLFENVEGYPRKIIAGVCGTRMRILKALGIAGNEFYSYISDAIRNPTPCEVEDGPVKEVIDKPKLSEIPVLTHFDQDPGPYITSAVLYARSPEGDVENLSFHRLLVLDDHRMTLRIVPRHLYRLTQLARDAKMQSIDVSVSLGLHPAIMVAAASPAPFGTNEFEVANTLLRGGLKLTSCEKVDALAPADAELVIEGKLYFDKFVAEGPFVDLTGTYDVERLQPIVEAVGVMHREDYMYQALLPAGAEHRLLMGMPREVRIWDYVRNVVPTVKGVNMTLGGSGWLHCVISFQKFREGDPKNVLMATFAAHPSLKHAIVVDSDIDPFDMEQVEWAIATRFRGDEDLLIIPHTRVSSLDPTSDQELELGCKVGLDATKPLSRPEAGFKKGVIPSSKRVKEILDKLSP